MGMRHVDRCRAHEDARRHASIGCSDCKLQCTGCKDSLALTSFTKDRGWVKAMCRRCHTAKVKQSKDDARFR